MQLESALALDDVGARGVDAVEQWEGDLDTEMAPARELLSRIEQMPTGPAHVAALNELQQMPLTEALRVRTTAEWERAASWVQAQKMLSLADTVSSLNDDLRRAAVYDISRCSRQSEAAVAAELRRTDVVSERLGESWVALNAGMLTYQHLLALIDVVKHASAAVAREVQARVLPDCLERGWTPGELRRKAEAAIAKVDPDGAEKRRRLADKHESGVSFRAEPDGVASLFARGAALPARQIMDEINRRADELRRSGDERALNQLQFEALRQAVLGTPVDSSECDAADGDGEVRNAGSAARPSRRSALLLVPLSTLLGGDRPGALEGYGPLSAQAIREALEGDLQFRRLVYDDMTGEPLELGANTWRPSEALRRTVAAFDRVCRVPGCSSSAMHCDIDHEIEWPEGLTTLRNCGLLCRRHHTLKTKKVYDLVADEARNVQWISPFGFVWEGKAATYDEFLDVDPPDDLDPWLPAP